MALTIRCRTATQSWPAQPGTLEERHAFFNSSTLGWGVVVSGKYADTVTTSRASQKCTCSVRSQLGW